MEVGVKVMGEDGLSATGGTGVPEKFGFLAYLQIGSDLLGAIVLDNDLAVRREVIFDREAVGEADGGWRDEFACSHELSPNDLLVTGADPNK